MAVKKLALCNLTEPLGLAPKRKRGKRARSPFVPAPGKKLTPHQVNVLRLVVVLTRELGKPPSAADVGKRLGMTRLGARRLLKELDGHGLAVDVPKTVRSGQWALTEAGAALLEEE